MEGSKISEHNLETVISRACNNDNQYFLVIGLVVTGFLTNFLSLLSYYWICDAKDPISYGIWNSCSSYVDDSDKNLTITECAIQTLNEIYFKNAEPQLLEELTFAKVLLIISSSSYFIVMCMLMFTFLYSKYMAKKKRNLIYLIRNLLVIILLIIILATFLQLIGLFLFIYVEKMSTGSFILFVYFLLAIFVTNTINFFTIKYKAICNNFMQLSSLELSRKERENMKY